MKLALIPPVPNLADFEHDHFHMCLPQLFDIPGYVTFYRNRSEEGDYIILDNGAHEGKSLSLRKLLGLAEVIGASEVVLPDVPQDSNQTVGLLHGYSAWLKSREGTKYWWDVGRPTFMFVPQTKLTGGQERVTKGFVEVAKRGIHALRYLPNLTIGIPRLYDNPIAGGDYLGIVCAIEQLAVTHRCNVHLLGWPRNLLLPRNIANLFPSRVFPSIRSIDTAKPIVYARSNKLNRGLALSSLSKYPGRPANYFTSPLTDEELDYARYNVAAFREALDPSASERTGSSTA